MTTKNDITGDALVSKTTTEAYREGYDRIFCKKTPMDVPQETKKLLIQTDHAPSETHWVRISDEDETE